MNNANILTEQMLKALLSQRTDKIPSGWFCRRDIEKKFNCSESTAARYIRKFSAMEGFAEKFFWVEGKKVNFYTVKSPPEPRESEGPGDSTDLASTGEQTNPPTPNQSGYSKWPEVPFVQPPNVQLM